MEKKEITMREALKMRGWKLEQMADYLGVSISLISKISNGQTVITKGFKDRFEGKFNGYTIINDKENWKERYNNLFELYGMLRKDAIAMQEELEDYKMIFKRISDELLKIGRSCQINSENVNNYYISDVYPDNLK